MIERISVATPEGTTSCVLFHVWTSPSSSPLGQRFATKNVLEPVDDVIETWQFEISRKAKEDANHVSAGSVFTESQLQQTWITTPGSLRDLVRQGDQMRCFFARWILMVQKFKNRASYHAYDKFVILIILSCPFPRFHEFQGASFALIESKVGHARLNFGMSTQLATDTHILFPCPNRISSEPETTMTENDALLATLI
jgi:hypothetical protein